MAVKWLGSQRNYHLIQLKPAQTFLLEAEQQVSHTKTRTLDAIDSKAVPADQDMCQMKHVTEASSTEQQTGIGFIKSPWSSKAQLRFTSPEI